MLAQAWISVVRAIFQGRKCYGVVGEHFMGRSVKQLRWQQSVVRPSVLSSLAANVVRDSGPRNIERGSNSTVQGRCNGQVLCGVRLTCPLRRLISFFLLVADPATLCGEKAVISKILLLPAAANPVAWESTVCWMKNDRSMAGRTSHQPARERVNDRLRDVVAGARRCVGRPR
jgi:hypothetical protein